MKLVFRTMIVMSMGTLAGCSWLVGEGALFDDSEYDYTKAEFTKEMQVPESVGESNVQDHYLVPELEDDAKGAVYGDDSNILAPMQVLTLGNKVRAKRESEDSAAYIIESKSNLSALINRYLTAEKIEIVAQDSDAISFQTGWQTIEDDSFWSGEITAWRYRYQITVSSAQRASENTLNVKIIEGQEFVNDTKSWRTLADTKRTETEFLNSIVGFMYVEDIATSRTLVNQSALGGLTVTLGTDDKGNPALVTQAGFEHVWTRIPITLAMLKIKVDDKDRSQRLYFITHGEEEKGFFSSLAFWSDDEHALTLLEGTYQLQVAIMGERVTMTFIDDENNPLSAELLASNFPHFAKAFKARAPNN